MSISQCPSSLFHLSRFPERASDFLTYWLVPPRSMRTSPPFHNSPPIRIIKWLLTVFWFSVSNFDKFENNSNLLCLTGLCAGVLGRMGVIHVMSTEYNGSILEYILCVVFRQWIVAPLKAGTMKIDHRRRKCFLNALEGCVQPFPGHRHCHINPVSSLS